MRKPAEVILTNGQQRGREIIRQHFCQPRAIGMGVDRQLDFRGGTTTGVDPGRGRCVAGVQDTFLKRALQFSQVIHGQLISGNPGFSGRDFELCPSDVTHLLQLDEQYRNNLT